MKREVRRTLDGKEFTWLTPETAEDYAELDRLEAEGKLDTDESLADQHKTLARKRKKGEAA